MKTRFLLGLFSLTLMLVLGLMLAAPVFGDVTVTPASGGTTISADTSTGAAGAAWTTLTGPTITEAFSGDIGAGTIVFTAPAGFKFNADQNVIAEIISGDIQFASLNTATPTANTITFTVTQASTHASTILFHNIDVQPTAGTPLSSGNIVNSGSANILGANGSTNFGTLTEVAGAATKYLVTSSSYSPVAGADVTISAQLTDQFDNPVATAGKVVTWSKNEGHGTFAPLTSTTNAGGLAAVAFTTHTVAGTVCKVTGTDGDAHTGQSADITTVVGAAAKVIIETAADGSGSAVAAVSISADQTLTVYGITRDAHDNFVANASTTWSLTGATGIVAGDLSVSPATSVTLTGNKIGTATIHAVTVAGSFADDTGLITVTAGAATHVVIEDAAGGAGSAVAAHSITADQTYTVYGITRDADDNFVANASTTWSLTGAAGIVAGDLSVSPAASVTLTGNKIGTATIHAVTVAGSFADDTGLITVTAGAATHVVIEDAAGGAGSAVAAHSLTADQTYTVYGITRDADDNFVANASTTWSLTGAAGIVAGDLSVSPAASVTLTGNKVGTATIHAVTVADSFADDTGLITVTVGTAAKVKVETQANGAGVVVVAQDLTAGSALTVYSITRDADDNFISNVAADAWSFSSSSGGVAGGDLVAAGDSKSAAMTGNLVGAGVIHAVSGILATTDSGTITVKAGTITTLTINQQPTAASASAVITPSVTVTATDAFTNVVSGQNIVVSKIAGTGTLSGTLTRATNGSGVATFNDLSIDIVGTGKQLRFTHTATVTTVDSALFDITAGAVATLTMVQEPTDNTGVGLAITPSVTVRARDAGANNLADINITVTLQAGTGVLGGTLTRMTDGTGVATFNDLTLSAAGIDKQLRFTSAAITRDSAVFTVIPVADLSDLTENIAAGLTPAFAAGTYTYTLAATNTEATVSINATQAAATSITYYPGEAGEAIVASGTPKVINLNVGANIITIRVITAGKANGTYTITVTRAAPVAPDGGGGGGLPPTPTPEPGTTDVTDVVTSTGEFTVTSTFTSADDNVSLTIGEGTTGHNANGNPIAEIQVTQMTNHPAHPSQAEIIGLTYNFGPNGATFDSPVTITFTYDPANLPPGVDPANLKIAFYDTATGTWVVLDNIHVDQNTHKITGTTTHFTAFTVIAYTTPASFTTTNLVFTPAEIVSGGTTSVKVTVTNSGDLAGTYNVVLKIDNQTMETKSVSVTGKSSAEVTFMVSKAVPGSILINVNELTGILAIAVAPEPAPTPTPTSKPAPVETPKPTPTPTITATPIPTVTVTVPAPAVTNAPASVTTLPPEEKQGLASLPVLTLIVVGVLVLAAVIFIVIRNIIWKHQGM